MDYSVSFQVQQTYYAQTDIVSNCVMEAIGGIIIAVNIHLKNLYAIHVYGNIEVYHGIVLVIWKDLTFASDVRITRHYNLTHSHRHSRVFMTIATLNEHPFLANTVLKIFSCDKII